MISVIVPYKNSEGWIERCVKSLIAQTVEGQFILVNDGSTDKSEFIARRTVNPDDPRFIFLMNPEVRAGVSGARNTGLDYAEGDWITFLDSDDEMMPDGLELYERMIAEDRRSRIHQANHYRYYAKIDKTALKYTNEDGMYDLEHLPHMWCMVWNKVYKRELIRNNMIRFDMSMRYGEDELFNLECLALEKKIHHSPGHIATIKRHFDNRQSLSHIKNREDILRQQQALVEFVKRQTDPEASRAGCRVLSEHWGSWTYLETFGPMGER